MYDGEKILVSLVQKLVVIFTKNNSQLESWSQATGTCRTHYNLENNMLHLDQACLTGGGLNYFIKYLDTNSIKLTRHPVTASGDGVIDEIE